MVRMLFSENVIIFSLESEQFVSLTQIPFKVSLLMGSRVVLNLVRNSIKFHVSRPSRLPV